jgi:3-dehydroquinate synthase
MRREHMSVLNDELPAPAPPNGAPPWSTAALTTSGDGREFRMTADLRRTHRVRLTRDVLSPDNPLLRDSVDGRSVLVVMSPSVHCLYGGRVRAYFAAPGRTEFMVLDRAESSKSIAGVIEVCERATAAGLLRTSPIVAIGGGVCSDICGLAASLHRRGIPHINVPTTLIGLVDAGIGTKNAVNYEGRKSALGSFHPPKLAIVRDPHLFAVLCRDGTALVESGFRLPATAAEDVILRAVAGMLAELAQNVYEIGDLRRSVDFGHTFSPYIEVASAHDVLHGEAVAMDIALSAQVAHDLGLLDGDDLDEIIRLLQDLGLAATWDGLSVDELWASLTSIVQHRDDELHLVVPTGIGRCVFLRQEAISPQLIVRCLQQLAGYCHTTQ